MPLTIVPHTKASHELPSAVCKAAQCPLMAGLSPHATITHFLVISNISLIIAVMNQP